MSEFRSTILPNDNPPANSDAAIWRYMDFTKFVSMLDAQSLYFARSDLMGDPFEGSFSHANQRLRPEYYNELFEHPEVAEDIFRTMGEFVKWFRQWTFVNCWYLSDYESAAMWKIYVKSHESIAIRSTYRRLRDCLPKNVYIGKVTYIDYDKDWMPEGHVINTFIHKRRSFEHERELRAIIQGIPIGKDGIEWRTKQLDEGKSVQVDLHTLIEKIRVAPTAPTWFRKLVADVAKKYELEKEVSQSSLDSEPFY